MVGPVPLAAPSLSQIGVDLRILAAVRVEARYADLVAAAQTTVKPRRETAFEPRPVNPRTVAYRPSIYLTASNNSAPTNL